MISQTPQVYYLPEYDEIVIYRPMGANVWIHASDNFGPALTPKIMEDTKWIYLGEL